MASWQSMRGAEVFFVKHGIVHRYPVPRRCDVRHTKEKLTDSLPTGFGKCGRCFRLPSHAPTLPGPYVVKTAGMTICGKRRKKKRRKARKKPWWLGKCHPLCLVATRDVCKCKCHGKYHGLYAAT